MATERIDVIVTETGAREVSRRIEDVGQAAARASGPLLAMQRLLASYVSFEGIRRLMQIADQYTEMENRIRVLDGTTQHYSVTLRRLYNISQETRSSLRDNVLLFQRMGLAQRELGATTEQLFQVTQAVGQAIAIQGGLATTSAGAVLQLSQAFGSGRVQLEEFNSVITGLYPIAKAAAEGIDATGGSIARLRRMIADGEVDSRMLFQGILNSLDSLEEQFKQTTPTVSQAFTVLRNSLVMYVGDLNSASGASESFARSIIALSKNMDEVVKGAVVLGAALGPAALTRVVLGLRAAFLALNVAIMANPFGAIATAVSASVTYLLLFNKNLDELAKKIDGSATVIDRMGATWAGVLAYIKKAWETFPEWFGGLIERAVDEGIKSLSKFGTRLFGDLEADVKQGEKILNFFGIKLPGYVNRAKDGLPQFKDALEDALNFDLPQGVIDRQTDNGSQAAQAFADAYEDYLLRARHRRETLRGGGGGGDGLPPGAPNEKALKKLQTELNRVLDAIDPVAAAWRKFFESVDTLDKGLAAGILTLEDYEAALIKLKAAMLDDVFPFEAIMRDLLTQRVLLSKEASERERLVRIYEVEKTLKRALTEEELELLDARLQMLQVAEREAQLMDEIQQPTLDHSRNIQALNNLYQDGVISASEFNQKLQELQYQFLQTQTDFGSGVERGLLAIERDFTDTASLIEQAMVRAFGNMEDALTDFFRTGKLSVKRFVDDVLNDLARLYVRQYITAPLAQSLGFMGDFSQNAGGSINLNFGAGSANSIGNVLSWMGDKMGSEALSSFAAGMKGATLAPGLHGPTTQGASGAMGAGNWVGNNFGSILGYGQAIYSLTQGNYGQAVGAAIGTYILPGLGTAVGSFFGGIVDSIFGDDKPKTRHAQMSHTELLGDGKVHVSTWDDRQSVESQKAAAQIAEQSINAALDLFDKIGIDAEFKRFTTLMESSILGDKQGVGSSATIRIGDLEHEIGLAIAPSWTLGGFGGWSEAEMLPRLATDIQLTILEAFQVAGDALPRILFEMLDGVDIRSLTAEQAQALVEQFSAVVEQVSALQAAMEQLPFENLRDLSFDAAASLLQLTGGIQGFTNVTQSYLKNYYTEAERQALAMEHVTRTLDSVNLAVPNTLAGFRALVDAQDLMTESGREAWAALMSVESIFAELANSAGDLVTSLSAFEQLAKNVQNTLSARNAAGALADQIGAQLGLSPTFAPQRERELWEALRSTSSMSPELQYLHANPDLLLTFRQGNHGMSAEAFARQHYQTFGQFEGRTFGADAAKQVAMAQELTDIVMNRINIEQQAARASVENATRILNIAKSLQSYLASLESSALAPYTLGEKVSNAEAELVRLVKAAQGGDETALGQVQSALQNALTLWRDYGASGEQYQEAYHRLTGMVGNLASQAVSEAERQIRQLEGLTSLTQTQIQQLEELREASLRAAQALDIQYRQEMAMMTRQLSAIERLGMDTQQLYSIAGSLASMPAMIAAHLAPMIPAVHGSHASGLWNVPYDGYRAELHAGERVLTASQTQAMDAGLFGGGMLVSEIQALRKEVGLLRQQNEILAQKYVQAVVESSRENAKQVSAGVGQAVARRERDDLNSRNAKRTGILA